MKLDEKMKFKILQNQSGEFLCEEIPDNWEDMEDEERDSFLTDNAWEPFENESASTIYNYIENSKDSVVRFIEREL